MSLTSSNESYGSVRKAKYSSQWAADTSEEIDTYRYKPYRISKDVCTKREMSPRDSDLSTSEHETDISDGKFANKNEREKNLQKMSDSNVTTQRRKVSAWQKLRCFMTGKVERKKTCSRTSERDSKIICEYESEYCWRGENYKCKNPTKYSRDYEAEKFKSRENETERGFREYSDSELDREYKSQQSRKLGRVSRNDSNLEISDYEYRRNTTPVLHIEEDSAEDIVRRNQNPRRHIRKNKDVEVNRWAPGRTEFNRGVRGNKDTEIGIDSRRTKITPRNIEENSDKEIDAPNNSRLNRDVSEDSYTDVDSRRSEISLRHVGDVSYRETETRPPRRLRWDDLETRPKKKQQIKRAPSMFRDRETESEDEQRRSAKLEVVSSHKNVPKVKKNQPLTLNRKSTRVSNDISRSDMLDNHDSERSKKSQIHFRNYNKSIVDCDSSSKSTNTFRNNIRERSKEQPLKFSEESTRALLEKSESYSGNETDPDLKSKSQNLSRKYLKSVVESVSSPSIDWKSRSESFGEYDSQGMCLRDSVISKRRIVSRDSIDSMVNTNSRETVHSVFNIAPQSTSAFSSQEKTKKSYKQSTNSERGCQLHVKSDSVKSNSKRIGCGCGGKGIIDSRNKCNSDEKRGSNTPKNHARKINSTAGDDSDVENGSKERVRANDSANSEKALKKSSERKSYEMRDQSKTRNPSKIQNNSEKKKSIQGNGRKGGNINKNATPRRKQGTITKRKHGSFPFERQQSTPPACAHLSAAQHPFPLSHYSSANPAPPTCQQTSCFHSSRFSSVCRPVHSTVPPRCAFTAPNWDHDVPQTVGTGQRPNTEALSPAMQPGSISRLFQQALGRITGNRGRAFLNKQAAKRCQPSVSPSRMQSLQRCSDSHPKT